jgi:hypothetical protein
VEFDAGDPHGPWRLWYGGCGKADNCGKQYVMYANSSDGLQACAMSLKPAFVSRIAYGFMGIVRV